MKKRLVDLILLLALTASAAATLADGQRFVRYGDPGSERPGLLDSQDRIRDMSARLADIDPSTVGRLRELTALDPETLPLVTGSPRLGPPLARVGKIIAVGFNYGDHAAESGVAIPTEPVLFMKAANALSGPFDPVVTPRGSKALDYEVELVVIIGRTASYVEEVRALDYVAGFAVGHDVSERDFQNRRGGQFVKGKSADTFAPVGPWLVTPEAIPDVQNLSIWSAVNDDRRQESNTRHMIFPVARLISYVSSFMTLEPGDLIFTGTPAGVGTGMSPPVYLKPGDSVALGIELLGRQRQVIAPPR